MFSPVNDGIARPQARILGASLLLHGLLLGWLLHMPGARVLAPSSVAAGLHGSSFTHLYWPTHSLLTDVSGGAAANSQHSAASKLTWRKSRARKPRKSLIMTSPDLAKSRAGSETPSAPSAAAGMPYGTAAGGAAFGDEIRPALPVSATDPIVDPHDLAGHGEGNVIVEVTIDDKGNIVQKVVLQSLGPLIDSKVLAALENWHFRPATRNGVAIASKQDVYYHFKPAG
jgi:TonB family protein